MGKRCYWSLPCLNSQDCQRVEICQQQKRELRVGDEIFWTRADPQIRIPFWLQFLELLISRAVIKSSIYTNDKARLLDRLTAN